jgi:anhydro-N-acetylmuramic acid kinase
LRDLYKQITELRRKETRQIIGLISGTSADGITAVLARISGTGEKSEVKLMGYKTYPYGFTLKERVFNLFKPGQGTVEDVCEMNYALGAAFGKAANQLIDDLDVPYEEVDLIGSHGQTIWHQPKATPISGYSANSTLQISEPAVISKVTGLPVVADFRKADMAAGGEGAPLTPYLDYVLHSDVKENRVLQNIGGVANLTYLPANASLDDIVAFDTGPGNMIIDAVVKKHTDLSHDVDGGLAQRGKANHDLLAELLAHPYYGLKPPKTTGREVFGEQYAEEITARAEELGLTFEDLVATVTRLTAKTIIDAYKTLPQIDAVYVSGGGARNPAIMDAIRDGLDSPVLDYSALGIPEEAKEALLMALLANEHVMGTPSNVPSATGAKKRVVLGYCTWI